MNVITAIATRRNSLLFLAATICALHAVPSLSSFPRQDNFSASQQLKKRQELNASGNLYAQTVQKVTIKVPRLKGETIQQAGRTLAQWHLLSGSVYGDDPKALICDQRPQAGEDALIGSKVSLWTVCQAAPGPTEAPQQKPSEKEGLVSVPDLHPYSKFFAVIVLAKNHLTLGGSTQVPTSSVKPGIIVDQDPKPGTMVPRNTQVFLVVSETPREQPPPTQSTLVVRPDRGSAVAGELITFTADLNPPSSSAQYQFTFGDKSGSGWIAEPHTRHAYSDDGNYEVRVSARLEGKVLEGDALEMPIHEVPYKVILIATPARAKTKDTIQFHVLVEPQKPLPADAMYLFDFGDSTNAKTSPTPDYSHAYNLAHIYWPRVTLLAEHKHRFVSPRVQLIIGDPFPTWLILAAIVAVIAAISFATYGLIRHFIQGRRMFEIRVQLDTGIQRLEVTARSILVPGVQIHAVPSVGVQTMEYSGAIGARMEKDHE